MKKADFLLAGAVLLAAAALYLLLGPKGPGAWVVVTRDGGEWGRYPLDQDATAVIGGEERNVLRIADGRASVVEANCGSQACVRTGEISREGEAIVCLPHRLVIRVEGGGAGDLDALAG